MIRGLRTVVYFVEDVKAAASWYEKIVGHAPYYNEPYYVGFNVGGFELGLHPTEGKTVERGESVAATSSDRRQTAGSSAATADSQLPASSTPTPHPQSVVAYWAVDDVDAAYATLLAAGATVEQAVQDVGGGIRLGTVKDPWGNTFGVIQNPHFKFSET